jgi:DNA-binding NtrC family response regulator
MDNALYVKNARSFFSRSICGIVTEVFDGWDINVVKSPSVALELLANNLYKAVLSDLSFGNKELNGIDFLLRVKEKSRDTETILVVGDYAGQCAGIKINDLRVLAAVDFFWKKSGKNEKIQRRGEKILAQLFQKKKRIREAGPFCLPENYLVGQCAPGCPCCQRGDGHA